MFLMRIIYMNNNPTTLIMLQALIELIPRHEREVCVMRWLRKYGFEQSYIKDDITNAVYDIPVLYLKFKTANGICPIHDYLITHKYFVDVYDLDINEIIYVFAIPSIYHEDYHIFLKGKYSQLSKKFKELFFNDPNFMDIFNKSDKLREEMSKNLGVNIPKENELWSKWTTDYDYITINNYINN